MSSPTHFYKYQSVYDEESPEKDLCIQNLIKSQAFFSTRKNFNDVFDSKITFKKPTAKRLGEARRLLKGEKRLIIEHCIKSGVITQQGKDFFRKVQHTFEGLLDSYLFYCLSAKGNSNLMWAHYANSHKGFCIEFDASYIQADPVTYQNELPIVDLLEAWAYSGSESDEEHLGHRIWRALRIKLEEWSHEEEYRFQLSNVPAENRASNGEKFILVPYQTEWVTSIIFGSRTSERVKDYIKNHLPYEASFKQAKVGSNELFIA